ncbi:putative non-specific serine/threonine protein kinase [Helianthus anomalus]
MFKVSNNGNLVILSGGNTVVWSSNSTGSECSNKPAVVQFMDIGNFIVWCRDKNSAKQDLIWQSFDYPGDTFLPGMKFGKDMVTGIERPMTCWKSTDDPSPSLYKLNVDIKGYLQILGWRGPTLISRPGPWNGLGLSGYPSEKPNKIFTFEFVFNEKENYYKYEIISYVLRRNVLTWDGKTLILHWI